MRHVLCLLALGAFAARAADPTPDAPVAPRVEERLDRVEHRLDRLEAKWAPAEPAQQPRPLYKRWYVWAGAAAIAAAVATGVAVAVSSGSSSTHLTPQQICGGPCAGTISAP